MLYTIFKPILQNRLRRALVHAIEENVARMALVIDEQLVQLANKAVEQTQQGAGGKTVQEWVKPSTTGGFAAGNVDTTGRRHF